MFKVFTVTQHFSAYEPSHDFGLFSTWAKAADVLLDYLIKEDYDDEEIIEHFQAIVWDRDLAFGGEPMIWEREVK